MKPAAVILIMLFPLIGLAQMPHCVMPAMDTGYFQFVVHALANDSMKGRLPGTNDEKNAAHFIENEFRRIGCKAVKKKRFTEPFDYTGPDSVMIHSAGNVIAKVNTRSEYCIVVTAHYDHIGYGKHHSNDPFKKGIHNGADDNASGIAVMLALADWCNKSVKTLKHDIIFVALSAEEDGLFGSKAFLASKLIDTSRIVCNVNLDMVGHLDLLRPVLVLEGAYEWEAWNLVLPLDSARGFLVQRRPVQFIDGSDHCTFLHADIPAILLTTGITQFYHRTSDDPHTLNYQGMVKIGEYLELIIHHLNFRDLPATFGRKRK